MADIKLIPPTGATKTLTDVVDLVASWEVNRPGMLTCRIPLTEFRRQGFSASLSGWGVQWPATGAAQWGGRVTGFGARDGVVEVGAEGWVVQLRKYLVSPGNVVKFAEGAAPGDALRTFLESRNLFHPFKFGFGSWDSTNGRVYFDEKSIDLLDDFLPLVTDDIDFEFRVGPDRLAEYGKRLGTDRSASVVLAEGQHVVAAWWGEDFGELANTLTGWGLKKQSGGTRSNERSAKKKRKPKPKPTRLVPFSLERADAASRTLWGRLEENRDYPAIRAEAVMALRLDAELARLKVLRPALTLDVAVTGIEATVAAIQVGDTVKADLGHTGYAGLMRVMAKAIDVDRGIATFSGLGDPVAGV